MKKTIVFFDVFNRESRRVRIPQMWVILGQDYRFIKWKFFSLNAINPQKYDSWQMENELNEPSEGATNNAANN